MKNEVLRLIDRRLAELEPIKERSSIIRAKIEALRELRRQVEGLGDGAQVEQP